MTEMAKDQIQSQYSDILKNTTTTTTTPTKTPIKKTNTNALDKF
ncbi:MAG: hypothetical protein WCG25_00290 [bacterium]